MLDEAQGAFIGTYAGPASPLCTREVMAACDCPVALGAIITDDYLNIMASSYGEMIAVNDEYARVGDTYFAQVTLAGFLDGLIARCEADEAFPRSWTPVSVGEEDEEPAPPGQLTYNRLYRQLTDFLKARGPARRERAGARREHVALCVRQSVRPAARQLRGAGGLGIARATRPAARWAWRSARARGRGWSPATAAS